MSSGDEILAGIDDPAGYRAFDLADDIGFFVARRIPKRVVRELIELCDKVDPEFIMVGLTLGLHRENPRPGGLFDHGNTRGGKRDRI